MRLAAPLATPSLAALCVLCALFALQAACSSSAAATPTVTVTPGLEASPISAAAGVTRVELRVRAVDGTETTVATAKPDDGGLDVPDAARTGIGSLVVAGLGADGGELAYGRTPALDLTGISSYSPQIFVQKPGLARMLTLPAAPVAPRVGMFGVRYLALVEPASRDLELVDLLTVRTYTKISAFVVAPSAAAIFAGTYALAVASDGTTSLVDFDAGTSTSPALPSGVLAADLAGARTIVGDDGAAYVVAATRAGSTASDLVLRLGTDGALTARRLVTKRAGATAVWIDGRGLVVMGGAADAGAAGAEILASGATTASPLPFATDATAGAIAVAVDPHTVLRAHADGTIDALDLACASACTPSAASAKLDGAPIDAAPLERGGALFATDKGSLLRVDAKGTTSASLGSLGSGTATRALVALPTGVVAAVSSSDAVLRTVR
jgi:hypothetical protein